MSRDHPDHHDADLVLRVYEMRRETLMRQNRDLITREFWPGTWEDLQAVLKGDHPMNAAFRQVSTYWEMVYGMVRHGIVHPEYFLESNGEGLIVFAKIHPHLERYRQEINPNAFRNAEWVATQCPPGQARYEAMKATVRRMAEARSNKK